MPSRSRSRALSSIAIAALLCVLAAAWWFGRGGARREVGPAAPIDSQAGTSAFEPMVATHGAGNRSVAAAEAQQPLAQAPPRSSAAMPGADGLLVRVRMRDTREPVADATVRWLDDWELDNWYEDPERLFFGRLAQRLESSGAAGRSGVDGTIRVPWPRIRTAVSARHGSSRALAYAMPHDEGMLVLELEPERHHEIRVLDADGVPRSGIPVALIGVLQGSPHPLWQGMTDAGGIARCTSIQSDDPPDPHAALVVGLDFPLRERVEQALPRGHGPFMPVELRMPPTGSVRVRVLEHDGRPSERAGMLLIQAERFVGGDPELPGSWRRCSGAVSAFRDDELHVPYIDLGLRLSFAFRDDPLMGMTRAQAPGPTRPGEEVVIDVRRDPTAPILRGRALAAESGEPIAHARLRIWVSSQGGRTGVAEPLATDGDGRFRIPIRSELHLAAEPGERTIHLSLPHGPGPLREGAANLLAEPALELLDLGDCALSTSALELIGSGRVLDANTGAPIAGARIELFHLQLLPGENASVWMHTDIDCVFSDEDGGFELRGRTVRSGLALDVSKPHHRGAQRVEFEFGSTDLALSLAPSGGFEGVLRVPAPIDPSELVLRAIPTSGQQAPKRAKFHGNAGGEFHADELEPGTYVLQVAESEFARPLIEFDGIEVRAGAITRDARLASIDLSALIRPIEVRVLGSDGAPLERGRVYVLGPELGEDRWRNVQGIEKGVATIAASTPLLDVLVSSEGHRSRHLVNVSSDVELRLERGFPVRLALPDLGTQPRERATLRLEPAHASARDSSDRHLFASETDVRTGSSGSFPGSFVLPSAGIWRVSGTRDHGGGGIREPSALEPASGGTHWTIEVLDQDAEQHFTLRLLPNAPAPGSSGD